MLAALRRTPRAAGLAVLSLAALGSFIASLWPTTPLAARPGFAAAVGKLTERNGRDAFVVVWPPHLAAVLDELPEGLLAADAVPLEPPQRRRFTRLLTLSPLGAAPPVQLRGLEPTAAWDFDEVGVREYVYPHSERVLFSLREELHTVRVGSRSGGDEVRCDAVLPGGGFACPGLPEWANVSPTTLTVSGAAWPCVWAHPVTGRELVIELSEQALGDSVRLEAALSDDAATTPGGAPITLVLEVGNQSRTLVRTNAQGLATTELATRRGERASVRLRVSAPFDGRRHLGLELRVLEAGVGP